MNASTICTVCMKEGCLDAALNSAGVVGCANGHRFAAQCLFDVLEGVMDEEVRLHTCLWCKCHVRFIAPPVARVTKTVTKNKVSCRREAGTAKAHYATGFSSSSDSDDSHDMTRLMTGVAFTPSPPKARPAEAKPVLLVEDPTPPQARPAFVSLVKPKPVEAKPVLLVEDPTPPKARPAFVSLVTPKPVEAKPPPKEPETLMKPVTEAPKPKKPKKDPNQTTKPKKDPNRIKKPTSAYIYYTNSIRESVKAAHPEMNKSELMTEMGRRWSEIKTDAAKSAPFVKQAQDDKARYERAAAAAAAAPSSAE